MSFLKRMVWIYSDKLPRQLRVNEYLITFRYPKPIGTIRLLLRSNEGADNFVHSEVFEHEYYRLPLAGCPTTILDLGANVGFTAVYFARLYPKASIACVEPIPQNVRVLRKNLMLNSIPATVFAVAAHSSDGTLHMELDSRAFGHKPATAETPPERTLEVKSLSIPTIIRELGWPRIDLLKIDVEGHERVLLSDPEWLEHVESLCIECHKGFGETELKELASTFGYGLPIHRFGLWIMTRERQSRRPV
jgi:FkbM family methyltransferase